jgi:hypothetical protein
MQKGLKLISLQGAIEKSPILLSQYWKNEWLDVNIIISYFGGSNNIFASCMYLKTLLKRIVFFITSKLNYNPELRSYEQQLSLFIMYFKMAINHRIKCKGVSGIYVYAVNIVINHLFKSK